jgi:hypothetical protein
MGGAKAIGPEGAARGRALAAAVGACVVALAAGWTAAPASARSDEVRGLARSLARQVAAPWPQRQHSNGRFYDEIGGHSAYGEAVLGYALVDVGIREHDGRLVRTGLKAMRFATDRISPDRGRTSVFQNMAVGLLYNLAERRLGHDKQWRRIRPTVRSYIRRQVLVHLRADNPLFSNKLVIEALEVLSFRSSGVTSSQSDAIVGPRRDRIYGLALDLVRNGVPRLFAGDVRMVGGDPTLLLSDRPDDPLAYMGLASGLYARAIDRLGADAGGDSRVTLRRSAEASWRLMAPDGDIAWSGRQLEQAWGLAGFANAARQAETYGGTSRARARRYDGVALRALERLRDVHVGGPAGILTVPAQRSDFDRSRLAGGEGDGYAPYGGLALMFLDMIADGRARPGQGQAPLRSDRGGASVLGHGQSLYATQRIGDVWMAVRGRNSVTRGDDLRYDAGLVSAKHRRPDGTWRDLIPRRPLLPAEGVDAAGPVIHTGGGTAVFAADRIHRKGRAGLLAVGGYRRLRGHPGVSRSAAERFRAVGCGVEVSFRARAGDRIEYSVFLRDPRNSGHGKRGVAHGGGTTATFSPPGHMTLTHDWISASDSRVLRARVSWHPRPGRRIRVRICDDGAEG